MFDPDLYRKTCSKGMKLSEETLEEMIFMTENKKHRLRRPVRFALTAAALTVVMCVTAAAANPEAVVELWKSLTVSVVMVGDDGNTQIIQADVPEVTVEETDGRTVLTIDGESADITGELARDGQYLNTWENADGKGSITVHADKTWEVEFTTADGTTVRYGSDRQCDVIYTGTVKAARDGNTYIFTEDDLVDNADYLPVEK